MGYYRNVNPYRSGPSLHTILIWSAIIVAVIAAFVWFFVFWMLDFPAVAWRDFVAGIWKSWLFPNGWNLFLATPFFTAMVFTALAIAALVFRWPARAWVAFVAIFALLAAGSVVRGWWVSDELGARYYLQSTTFEVVDETDLPSSLIEQATSDESMVPIEQGKLPASWVPRVASATGALKVLTRTGDAINNTSLMTDSLTYLYDSERSGHWTAIRNGANQQPIYGIAAWNGTGEQVETCTFSGKNELNKAFGGLWGNNLWNAVAGAYPSFLYSEGDMWGYCDGEDPIIVLPGVSTSGYDTRTVDKTTGVLTIKGSASGDPVIEMHTDVTAGDFPGPVYPQRMVNQQRDSLSWAAGRHLNWFKQFGYEVADGATQGGNNSNFLLKNEADGRLYWVTPMKPRSTDSQTLVAYSVIPADEVTEGKMNPQVVYVMNEEDLQVVNLDDLEARVIDAVRDSNPGFFTGDKPGSIVEFLPVSDDTWQVFAEVNGRVKYRIDVNVDAAIVPSVIDIESGEVAEGPAEGVDATCDDPSTLSDAQLAACLVELSNELQGRGNEE